MDIKNLPTMFPAIILLSACWLCGLRWAHKPIKNAPVECQPITLVCVQLHHCAKYAKQFLALILIWLKTKGAPRVFQVLEA